MFLTYTEYVSFGGALPEAIFNRLEYKARAYINHTTHNRIRDETPVRECIQRAAFDLIELLNQKESTDSSGGLGVSSKSNDGISVTYADATRTEQHWSGMVKNLMAEYLSDQVKNGVPILYGGVEYDTLRE